MGPEIAVERFEPAGAIGILERGHLLEQVGMAADGALPELDQAAGDDIRALDRDADRDRAGRRADIIVRTGLPLPPCASMASLPTPRSRSVACSFMTAVITAGLWP